MSEISDLVIEDTLRVLSFLPALICHENITNLYVALVSLAKI